MKQKVLFIIALSLLFTSCIFVPDNDISDIREKKSYKSFTELNNPLIIKMPLVQKFNLYGNQKFSKDSRIIGNALVIYDTANNSIFDYVYVPQEISENAILLPVKKNDSTISYYGFDVRKKVLYEMNPAVTEVKKYNLDVKENTGYSNPLYFTSVINNYFFVVEQKFSGYIHIFDTNTNTWKCEIKYERSDISPKIIQSDDGKFWFFYSTYDDSGNISSKINRLSEINIADNKLESPIVSFNAYEGMLYDEKTGYSGINQYDVLKITSDKIIFSKEVKALSNNETIEKSFVLIDRNNLTQRELIISETTDINFVKDLITVNGQDYIIYSSKATSQCKIAKIDFTNKKIEADAATFDSVYWRNIYINNSKSYFVEGYDKISIQCFDSNTKKIETVTTFEAGDLYEKSNL